MRRALVAALALVACAQPIGVAERPRGSGGGTDASSAGRDGSEADAGGLDAGARDGSSSDAGALACLADPFAPCADVEEDTKRNDEWHDATYFNDNRSIGCLRDDELTSIDRTRRGVLCPNDPADYQQVMYVHCDTRTLLLELRYRPLTMCQPDAVELFGRGFTFDCTSPETQCVREGEDQVIRARVPPGATVGNWTFGVRKLRTDIRVEYELRLLLR